MKIYKQYFIFIVLLIFLWGCGIKKAPEPKKMLMIPPPDGISINLEEEGILIVNTGKDRSIFVEKSEYTGRLTYNRDFKRVASIQPLSSFLDTDVEDDKTYMYRIRNYDREFNAYSVSVVKNVSYYIPVKIKNINIEQFEASCCIMANMTKMAEYADVIANGQNKGSIKENEAVCFDLPNIASVNLMVIPYDKKNQPGTPYIDIIQRDENSIPLPPENIKIFRAKGRITISWDKNENMKEYAVYLNEDGKSTLLEKTEITLFQYLIENDKTEDTISYIDDNAFEIPFDYKLPYDIHDDEKYLGKKITEQENKEIKEKDKENKISEGKCFTFEISAIRKDGEESAAISVTSCP